MRLSVGAIALGLAVLLAGCSGGDQPDAIKQGRTIYGDVCSVCHGARGRGGVGPALDTVTANWPECSDQVEWIGLGSDGWKARHGDTYGATANPVKGGMPAHEDSLTLTEIRLVAAFERSEYGAVSRAAALQECGLESP